MGYDSIIYEPRVEDGIARLTLNRPDRLNALSLGMCAEIEDALRTVERDDEAVVLVLRGAGRAFSVGMDFTRAGEVVDGPPGAEEPYEMVGRNLWRLHKVCISQVHGHALGAGQALAIEADITMASEDAQFGYPEPRFGQAHVVPHFYNRTIGPKRTKEYFFTGRFFSAREAYDFNLINHVVAGADLERETLEMAREIVALERRHPGQLACMKAQINRTHPDLLVDSDPFTVWGARVERDYVARIEEMKGRYYRIGAEGGSRAMLRAMQEPHAGSDDSA